MLRDDEKFVHNKLEESGGLSEINQAIKDLKAYGNTTYGYDSKNTRLDQWYFKGDPDMYELVLAVFTTLLIKGHMTYQAACSALKHKIDLKDEIDQIKTIAEVLAVISKSGLIEIERRGSGNSIIVSSTFDIDWDIPVHNKHKLIFAEPREITTNFVKGKGSLLSGHRLNHHDGNICLDHLNRLNRIPLSLNFNLISAYEETTDKLDEPKEDETLLEFEDRKRQWEIFIKDSSNKYAEVEANGNRLWLEHFPDSRGRFYARGFHIDSQGSQYKKAILELAEPEIVEV